jgi:hypothetical protein
VTKHSDKPGLPDDARAGHPSRSHPGDPAVDPNPDDVLDAEVVELVLRELGDSAAEPDAQGATLHSLGLPSPVDGDGDEESDQGGSGGESAEVYDYEGVDTAGVRPDQGDRLNDERVESSHGSIASVGSAGSIAATGSVGSIASTRSAGSIASALSAGSIGSLGAIGSFGSILSIGSFRSILSIGSRNSVLSIGAVDGFLTIGRGPHARSFGRR